MSDYFSDRELGAKARIQQELSPIVWSGLVVVVNALLDSGSFGGSFPALCPDGPQTIGNDDSAVGSAIAAEIENLTWPLETHRRDAETSWERIAVAPPTMVALDLIEFVWRHVGTPQRGMHHKFFDHHHLSFDRNNGRAKVVEDVNRILARNGLAYELGHDGKVRRLMPAVLGEAMARTYFNTANRTLDVLLEESRIKFSSPDPLLRREALERLFDAWERIKSMADNDKKRSIAIILNKCASETSFRLMLETEARALTDVGNTKLLRHHEFSQDPVVDVAHVDYLYHRLFALIQLIIGKTMRL